MENKPLTIKETQEESFIVLLKIKEICENQNLTYWLSFGTLLGSIRNDDFIPWDDDVDIFMPRKDFEEFVQYCKTREQDLLPFKLFHFSTNSKYIYPIGRFSNTEFKLESYVRDCGLGVFVDIYPIDGFNENDLYQLKRINKQKKIISRLIIEKRPPGYSRLKYLLLRLWQIVYNKNSLHSRIMKIDLLSQKYDYANSEYVSVLNWEPELHYSRSYFNSFEKHLFHGKYFPVPSGYKEFLSCLYGNYMELPPENERVPHHDYVMYRK